LNGNGLLLGEGVVGSAVRELEAEVGIWDMQMRKNLGI